MYRICLRTAYLITVKNRLLAEKGRKLGDKTYLQYGVIPYPSVHPTHLPIPISLLMDLYATIPVQKTPVLLCIATFDAGLLG